jgi:pSer/pThr/pTyr-binding forkhead associated (FHA) protein
VHGRGYAFSGTAQELASEKLAPESEPPARCWVTWREHTRELVAGDNVVGRDPACEVWIDARGVSRRHARITVMAGAVTVEDLASTNGTFVGSAKVKSARSISDGDVIGLGPETVTFRAWSEGLPATEPVRRRGARARAGRKPSLG